MLILGFNGGADLAHENIYGLTSSTLHDSACVLIEDGKVLFAIEEERLNRIKHTNKFPAHAMRSCLDARRIQLSDIDLIAYPTSKETTDRAGNYLFRNKPEVLELADGESIFQFIIYSALNQQVSRNKIRFVHHHYAHARSAVALSGFDESLIITIDGMGDKSSGMVFVDEGIELKQLANFPDSQSLGAFYVHVIRYLGFNQFDEYKVMGLAPYGDSAKHRELFKEFYTLLPNGNYILHSDRLPSLLNVLGRRRVKGELFMQEHKNIAASLQEALESIVFHIARHHQRVTKRRNLCLAGGVAHNCTLNGKLLRSGLFENIFVQPAAHDAGAALGCAFHAYYQERPKARKPPCMEHVYWGTDIGESQSVLNQLKRWEELITIKKPDDICKETAGLLANGNVIGWVQGRSEFGPRALGNRSILADPRPAENKDRINGMVKKREAYRPFAPSVLEEHVKEFFHVPAAQKHLPFMIFIVDVKEDKRELLGAVTHIDGTARAQTVSKQTNERYWRLIDEFRAITGVPILLNTSFNNNVEPIVDSVEDALACYLTTELDHLIIGDYLVSKKELRWHNYLSLKPALAPYISLQQTKRFSSDGVYSTSLFLKNTYNSKFQHDLSPEIYRILDLSDGKRSLKKLIAEVGETDDRSVQNLVLGLIELWTQRIITLKP